MQIELNDEFKKALDLMENSDRHVFITGKAGTGKSTLLEYFKNTTKKNAVFLAPTGVAAIRIGGQTIHSFFGFKPGITVDDIKNENFTVYNSSENIFKAFKRLQTVVIDEVSMLRADLLDCIDALLRLRRKDNSPFGGVQMIFIGDPYQLPPVVPSAEAEIFTKVYQSPYFFDAHVFKEIDLDFVELKKVYRQKDDKFIEILNRIRNNKVTDEDIEILNSRVVDENVQDDTFAIYLTSLNESAAKINNKKLSELPGKEYFFEATIYGDIPKDMYPTDEVLVLKEGAQIMLLNNDSQGRWINGTIGRIEKIVISDDEEDPTHLVVRLSDGKKYDVYRKSWDVIQYYYDSSAKKINSRSIGTFIQFPVRLAWAITVHKSQGLTFDNIVIDKSRGMFAPGQMYVALSRATSLNGVRLVKPIKKTDIFVDRRIVMFMNTLALDLLPALKCEDSLCGMLAY